MGSSVTLVIFEGGMIESELEELMRQVRKAIVIDQILKAKAGGFEQIIVVTSYTDLAEAVAKLEVDVDYRPQVTEEFHFGEQLLRIVTQRKIAKVLYMGGAAAPLISAQELRYIRTLLENHDQVVTANNYFSADLVGFAPASALAGVTLPEIDNSLPQLLVHEGNLKFIPLQRSLGLHFDLDTPADLVILANHPGAGFHTKEAIAKADIDTKSAELIARQCRTCDLAVYAVNLYYSNPSLPIAGFACTGERAEGSRPGCWGEARRFVRWIAVRGYEEFFRFLSRSVGAVTIPDPLPIGSGLSQRPVLPDRFHRPDHPSWAGSLSRKPIVHQYR